MKRRLSLTCQVIITALVVSSVQAGVNFGSKGSAIEVVGAAAKLNVTGAGLTVLEGTVRKESSSQVLGNTITFSSGIFSTAGSDISFSGKAKLTDAYEIMLNGGTDIFRAEPGIVMQKLIVRGAGSRLEGQPIFRNPDSIQLHDFTSTLTIAIQNSLNKRLLLNNGTLYLGDDLKLADDVRFTESGTIVAGGYQLSLGGKELLWTGTYLWKNAGDIVLNNDVRVRGQWIFKGNAQLTGNGNTLDLTNGATIWVKKNTTLDLNDIKIRGWGSGFFVFEDKTSQIRVALAEMEMDRNVTMTRGGLYVNASTHILVKNNTLTFDGASSLTVDGCPLFYETLEFADGLNIKPIIIDDPNNKFITYLNNGTILKPKVDIIGNVTFDYSTTLTLNRYLLISPANRLYANSSFTMDGNTNIAYFTRVDPDLEGFLVIIAPATSLFFKNIVLRDFAPSYASFGSSTSKLIFDDRTTLEIFTGDLNYTWTFQGNCVLDGVGRTLTFGPNGRIVLVKGATLEVRNMTLKGVRDNRFRCDTNASRFTFNNTTIVMDADFTFSMGKMDITGDLDLTGTFTFHYTTNQTSNIGKRGRFIVDRGSTFRYAPSSTSKTLITMTDNSSEILLQGGTLATTTTGIQLTKGTLGVDFQSFLTNPDGVSDSQAIVFGDGTAANDLKVVIHPAASIQLLSGKLLYKNVN